MTIRIGPSGDFLHFIGIGIGIGVGQWEHTMTSGKIRRPQTSHISLVEFHETVK